MISVGFNKIADKIRSTITHMIRGTKRSKLHAIDVNRGGLITLVIESVQIKIWYVGHVRDRRLYETILFFRLTVQFLATLY